MYPGAGDLNASADPDRDRSAQPELGVIRMRHYCQHPADFRCHTAPYARPCAADQVDSLAARSRNRCCDHFTHQGQKPYRARRGHHVVNRQNTYQITVEPGITITAPRTTSRDIKRHKNLELPAGLTYSVQETAQGSTG
jgi:hypothetical protein